MATNRTENWRLPPSFISDGGQRSPLLIFAYAIVATIIGGFAHPVAGLAILVLGLLAATGLDLADWLDSERGAAEAAEPADTTVHLGVEPAPAASDGVLRSLPATRSSK